LSFLLKAQSEQAVNKPKVVIKLSPLSID
jgi:hypothetical protein